MRRKGSEQIFGSSVCSDTKTKSSIGSENWADAHHGRVEMAARELICFEGTAAKISEDHVLSTARAGPSCSSQWFKAGGGVEGRCKLCSQVADDRSTTTLAPACCLIFCPYLMQCTIALELQLQPERPEARPRAEGRARDGAKASHSMSRDNNYRLRTGSCAAAWLLPHSHAPWRRAATL